MTQKPATPALSPCLPVSLPPSPRVSPSGRFAQRALLLVGLALATAACQTRKDFPEPSTGYHTPGYSVLFGRLQRVPAADPDAPPVWLVRFGSTSDAYQGALALTDLKPLPEFIHGYAGGERVEIHGHIYNQPSGDAYNGRWYVVDSIQIWNDYRE